MGDVVVITCEHAANRIPPEYARLFRGCGRLLDSHRGYDAGALVMARELATAFRAPLVTSKASRLLIDLNRSLSNPRAWSEKTRLLPAAEKQRIIERHYAPYRKKVAAIVGNAIASGNRVIHISSHSFTPVLNGHVRTADVGILYDPSRGGEAFLAGVWKSALAERDPDLRVRRNYPYAGKGDGLTRTLRQRHSASSYVGIELELNQAFVRRGDKRWLALRASIVATLRQALDRRPRRPLSTG